jgi:hypothetical protein
MPEGLAPNPMCLIERLRIGFHGSFDCASPTCRYASLMMTWYGEDLYFDSQAASSSAIKR